MLDLSPSGVQDFLLELRLRVVLLLINLYLLFHLGCFGLFLHVLKMEMMADLASPFQNRANLSFAQQLQVLK
jgi:hypothetical protein